MLYVANIEKQCFCSLRSYCYVHVSYLRSYFKRAPSVVVFFLFATGSLFNQWRLTPLSVNPTKWSDTLNQFVGFCRLPEILGILNLLSVIIPLLIQKNTCNKFVGNKAKRGISKRMLQQNKACQIFRKTNNSYL